MIIYLAGDVPKGNEEAKSFDNWRVKYQKVLESHFKAEFIDPHDYKVETNVNEGDFLSVFGADCNHIKNSDLVIVNCEEKLGVGTAQEIVIAKYFEKLVIVVLPRNTHHRRSNIMFGNEKVEDWIHPFIFCFADFIIEDILEIEKIKDEVLKSKGKTLSIIDEAIEYAKSKHNK